MENLPFLALSILTFLDLQPYWVKLSWPLCPYVDEWLSHTHFVRFWCSGVDSVTLTRKVCDPSALKAVWPQQRSGRSGSPYEAAAAFKKTSPGGPWSCEVEGIALITAALQWGEGGKNTWLVLIVEKPCWSPKVWRRSTLSLPSLGN